MVKDRPEGRRPRFDSSVGKIPSGRAWQPTPVFLPGEFHGQRTLAGYSSWTHKKSQTQVSDFHFRKTVKSL